MNSVQTLKTNQNDFERSPEAAADFVERVRVNQRKLASELKPQYDFVVCGSGSSGSVVARRLAENPSATVLLLEAGGDDDVPSVMDAKQWTSNVWTVRDWALQAQPHPPLNRPVGSMRIGNVLRSRSSIHWNAL